MNKNFELLDLLKVLQDELTPSKLRLVVTGGLGIAGYLGSLYREFFDLDLTVIGTLPFNQGIELLKTKVKDMGGKIVYEEKEYFQSKINDLQVDFLYIQQIDTAAENISYVTAKQTITGSKRLLEPIEAEIDGHKLSVFCPEIAAAEKLVGSVTLGLIREKDIQDLEMVLPRLDSNLLFEAINKKFVYTHKVWDNTGF